MIQSAARQFAATVRGGVLSVCASHWSRVRVSVAMGLVAVLAVPLPAKADPISGAIATLFFTAGTTAAAVATFVITAALTYGVSLLTNALFGPKSRQQERQASVLQLNIGEVPREVVFGEISTGGSLVDPA